MIVGIGTDLIEVKRIEKSVQNPAFLNKIFSDREQEICKKKQSNVQSLAARFAAKESFMKALGTGWSKGIKFNEIEILNDDIGKPKIYLKGNAKKKVEKFGINKIFVTLSHLKEIATATVILEKINE